MATTQPAGAGIEGTQDIDSKLLWFHASDLTQAKPGNATYNTCYIYVPFAHRLVKASLAASDVGNAGTFTVDLMQADETDAQAGTSVDQLGDSEMVATTDTVSFLDFTITSGTDDLFNAAGRLYWLKCVGTNAGDIIDDPCLSIGVEPKERSRL